MRLLRIGGRGRVDRPEGPKAKRGSYKYTRNDPIREPLNPGSQCRVGR